MDADDLVAARQAETLDVNPDRPMDGHCKAGPPHIVVLVVNGPGRGVDDTTVRYLEHLVCVNDPSYHDWGALLHHAGKQEGLHLFPTAVEYLAMELPVAALEVGDGESVAIAHTFKKALRIWRQYVPDAARKIAVDLGVLIPK